MQRRENRQKSVLVEANERGTKESKEKADVSRREKASEASWKVHATKLQAKGEQAMKRTVVQLQVQKNHALYAQEAKQKKIERVAAGMAATNNMTNAKLRMANLAMAKMVTLIKKGSEKRKKKQADRLYQRQLQEKRTKGQATQTSKLRDLKWERRLAKVREAAEAATKKAVMQEVHRRHQALAVQETKRMDLEKTAAQLVEKNNDKKKKMEKLQLTVAMLEKENHITSEKMLKKRRDAASEKNGKDKVKAEISANEEQISEVQLEAKVQKLQQEGERKTKFAVMEQMRKRTQQESKLEKRQKKLAHDAYAVLAG